MSKNHHGAHDHGDHAHSHSHETHVNADNQRYVAWAALLTGLFMLVEFIGGIMSGSLTLIADAGHMLTDFAALSFAWAAFLLSSRPPTDKLTYGYERYTVLAAFVNSLALILLSLWIFVEAVRRFQEPGEVLAGPMLAVAIAGLVVNIIVWRVLSAADQENLNVRGAMLHVLGDLLGSVAAIAAALIIMSTGWMQIDPILSVFVSLLILKSAVSLLRDSAHILLQGAPHRLSRSDIARDLENQVDGVSSVDHMHIWSLTPERPMLTVMVYAQPGTDVDQLREAVLHHLEDVHQIDHVTLDIRASDMGASGTACGGRAPKTARAQNS